MCICYEGKHYTGNYYEHFFKKFKYSSHFIIFVVEDFCSANFSDELNFFFTFLVRNHMKSQL